MRSMARSSLVIILAFAMLNLSAFAAGQPLGTVIQAQDAHLSNASAEIGATVYPGDAIATEQNGTMRLRVGSGQVFLGASSAAYMTDNAKITHLSIERGTVGFSGVSANQFEMETPVGLVRPGNGQRAQGQVIVTGPHQITLTAYAGTLVLERNGESRTVEAGNSFNVSFNPDAAPTAQTPSGQGGSGNNTGGGSGGGSSSSNKGQWVFVAIVVGATAVGGYFIWHFMTESTTSPSN